MSSILNDMLKLLTPPLIDRIIARVDAQVRRSTVRRKLEAGQLLHLGCGTNVLAGWVNIDGSPVSAQVLRWNLLKPLPVKDSHFQCIFSEHFIEHVSRTQAQELLQELARCLGTGGQIRVSTPDLRYLVTAYLDESLAEWLDVGWEPATAAKLMNEGMHAWGHQFLYDFDELRTALLSAGFSDVRRVAWRESQMPAFRGLECRPFHNDLIVEATKL